MLDPAELGFSLPRFWSAPGRRFPPDRIVQRVLLYRPTFEDIAALTRRFGLEAVQQIADRLQRDETLVGANLVIVERALRNIGVGAAKDDAVSSLPRKRRTSENSVPTTDPLPSTTARLIRNLSALEGIERFRLVGGTALAMHYAHRRSEDVDLAVAADRLPRRWIRGVVDSLRQDGQDVRESVSVAASADFEDAGLDLLDYHQDWIVGGVKLTFFAPDRETGREALAQDVGVPTAGRLLLASPRTLFVRCRPRRVNTKAGSPQEPSPRVCGRSGEGAWSRSRGGRIQSGFRPASSHCGRDTEPARPGAKCRDRRTAAGAAGISSRVISAACRDGCPRQAVAEIATPRLKTLVLAERHNLRDLYDLRALMVNEGYDFSDLAAVFDLYRPQASMEAVKDWLIHPRLRSSDPGLTVVSPGDRERIDEDWGRSLGEWFADVVDEYEQRVAPKL